MANTSIGSASDDPAIDYRALFEAAAGRCLVLDPELTIVAATDDYLSATLTDRAEIVGRALFDVFPDDPDDPGSDRGHDMRASLARVLERRTADVMPVAGHDAADKPWSATNVPLLDDQGAVAYVIHKVEDATEISEHRTEVATLHTQLSDTTERLQQRDKTLHEFLDYAPAVISARDVDGRLLICNQLFEARFRRQGDPSDPNELVGPETAAIAADLFAWSESLEAQVIETGTPVSTEVEIPELDGLASVYEMTKFPLRTLTGEVFAVGTIAMDVTNDRRARGALRASDERFRQMADNIDEAFLLWEAGSLNMLYVSPAMERVTGLDAAIYLDPVARLEAVHPDDRGIVSSPPAPTKEFRIVTPDGAVRWIRSRTSIVETPDGLPDRGVSTLIDFTEQKVAELAASSAHAEAEAANRAKSEFLSRMSHELRSPLNAILGFGQLLALDELRSDQTEAVEQIIRAGHHLLALVDEVLDLSRVETGDLRVSLEPVSLRDVVAEAVGMARPLADHRRVRILMEPGATEVHVTADRQRLVQVLLNLLVNAVKYNREGGEVRVEGEEADGRFRLTVSDTGIGIAEQDLGRVFQPFERLSAAQTEVEGTGLGLALVRHLATAMAGTVGVRSRLGEGSSFWVELPVSETPIDLRPAPCRRALDVPPGAGGQKTVLYVEDNLSNVKLLERLVERRPEVVLMVAMQGQIALDLAGEHVPDLILLDLHLPDMSGEDVLRALRAEPRTAEAPIVVLSADATAGGPGRLRALGATDYLTKPFDIPRLLEIIDATGARTGPAVHDVRDAGPPPDAAPAVRPKGVPEFVHDLNNLLGVILSYCTLLGRAVTDGQAEADLAEVRVAAERAVTLTAELRALARGADQGSPPVA
jgi:PAS domain S-box-containing protein